MRVPARRPRHVHVPRDEHAPPGRAPRHRARHRPRPRRGPAPDRRRRAAGVHPGRRPHRRPRDRGPPLRRGRRERLPARDRAHRAPSMAGRRRHPGRCRRRRGRRGRWAVRSDARQDRGPRRRPGGGAGPADAGARCHRRAGSDHEPAVPALARARAGGPRRRGPDEHAGPHLATGRLDAAGADPGRGLVGGGARAARGRRPAARRADGSDGFRLNAAPTIRLVSDDETHSVQLSPGSARTRAEIVRAGDTVHLDFAGRSTPFRVAPPPDVDRAASAAASPRRRTHGARRPDAGPGPQDPRRRSVRRSRRATRS